MSIIKSKLPVVFRGQRLGPVAKLNKSQIIITFSLRNREEELRIGKEDYTGIKKVFTKFNGNEAYLLWNLQAAATGILKQNVDAAVRYLPSCMLQHPLILRALRQEMQQIFDGELCKAGINEKRKDRLQQQEKELQRVLDQRSRVHQVKQTAKWQANSDEVLR